MRTSTNLGIKTRAEAATEIELEGIVVMMVLHNGDLSPTRWRGRVLNRGVASSSHKQTIPRKAENYQKLA